MTRPPAPRDLAAIYQRWAFVRAALHRGYWLITSLYLVLDAGLTPAQLVLIGVAQGAVCLIFEIPTGVVADTISRTRSLVMFHVLVSLSMVATGLVRSFPALLATQMLWGLAWTFASGADVAWISDELADTARTARVITAAARAEQVGAACGMVACGLFAWAAGRSIAMVTAGAVMGVLGLYVHCRFTEHAFQPTHTQRWQRATVILTRGIALARNDRVIMAVFAATFLLNGASGAVGRLYPKSLLASAFPTRPDPVVWFTALGIVTFAAGACALRLVETHIASAGVPRRAYVAACATGTLGVIMLAAAPDAVFGSAGVVLAAGVAWTVARAAGVVWVNARVTGDVRATVQSLLSQGAYLGEIVCGLALALLAQSTSIHGALLGGAFLVSCAALVVYQNARQP